MVLRRQLPQARKRAAPHRGPGVREERGEVSGHRRGRACARCEEQLAVRELDGLHAARGRWETRGGPIALRAAQLLGHGLHCAQLGRARAELRAQQRQQCTGQARERDHQRGVRARRAAGAGAGAGSVVVDEEERTEQREGARGEARRVGRGVLGHESERVQAPRAREPAAARPLEHAVRRSRGDGQARDTHCARVAENAAESERVPRDAVHAQPRGGRVGGRVGRSA